MSFIFIYLFFYLFIYLFFIFVPGLLTNRLDPHSNIFVYIILSRPFSLLHINKTQLIFKKIFFNYSFACLFFFPLNLLFQPEAL